LRLGDVDEKPRDDEERHQLQHLRTLRKSSPESQTTALSSKPQLLTTITREHSSTTHQTKRVALVKVFGPPSDHRKLAMPIDLLHFPTLRALLRLVDLGFKSLRPRLDGRRGEGGGREGRGRGEGAGGKEGGDKSIDPKMIQRDTRSGKYVIVLQGLNHCQLNVCFDISVTA
jgi:hypothetical protein